MPSRPPTSSQWGQDRCSPALSPTYWCKEFRRPLPTLPRLECAGSFPARKPSHANANESAALRWSAMATTGKPKPVRGRAASPPLKSRQTNSSLAIAIMAAGKGTRLKSKHPKVLHQIAGKTLLEHVVAAATQLAAPKDIYAIIGHEAERVHEALKQTGIQFVVQREQRGTGHAIMTAQRVLARYENVLVLSGDVPLIQPETIQRLRDFHLQQRAAMTILTAQPADPSGYGRIIRKKKSAREDAEVEAIVEQNGLSGLQENLREINSGIYAFATAPLFAFIDKLSTNNPHREIYLTDMAQILSAAGKKVIALPAGEIYEVLGCNTRAELA